MSVSMMAMDLQFAKQHCALCAQICDQCSQDCEMFKDHHCEKCAEECRKMGGM